MTRFDAVEPIGEKGFRTMFETKIKGRPGILNGLVVEGCLSKQTGNTRLY